MLTRLRSRIGQVIFFSVILLPLLSGACRKVAIRPAIDENLELRNWPQFGLTPERTNFTATRVAPPLKNVWIYKTSSAVSPTMLAVNGALIFTTLDGRFEILDIATGERRGRGKCEGQYEAAAAYRRGFLFFASRYGQETLVKYDLLSGKPLWKIDAGDIASEPLIAGDAVYVAALYHRIEKYDFESGERIWSFKSEDQHRSSPALKDDVLVAGCDNGVIYALNAQTGKLTWKVETGASVVATPVISAGKVFVGSNDSTFYALQLADGAAAWTFLAQTPIFQSAASDGRNVLFGASDGQFYCLDAETGRERWRFRAGSAIGTAPLIADDLVYFGSLDRRYYCLDLESGALLWSFETRGRVRTAPIIWENYILGASEDRFVYAFAPADSLAGLAL